MSGESAAPEVRVAFDSRVFSLAVIQKACLKFSAVASFTFMISDDRTISVEAFPSTPASLDEASLVAQLRTEVLDQNLREIVFKETESERNLILAYAFSNTKLLNHQ